MNTASNFESVSIVGQSRQPVCELAGFDRRIHSIPTKCDERAFGFVAQIATADVEQDLESVFQKLKKNFKFKRVEIAAHCPEPGCGAIETPYFVYSIQVQPEHDDPAIVRWERNVLKIESSEMILTEAFSCVFDYMFDRVEFCFNESFNLADWIDNVEERDDPKLELDYDSQLTSCTLAIENLAAKIEIKDSKVAVVHPCLDTTASILHSFLEAKQAISLGLPQSLR